MLFCASELERSIMARIKKKGGMQGVGFWSELSEEKAGSGSGVSEAAQNQGNVLEVHLAVHDVPPPAAS
jgi:hypothetical protein